MSESRPVVLIAEDEPIASMALRAQLEALDYSVVATARDGAEALSLGSCFPLDVAVFDQRMPHRTGLEAAIALFQDAPTPVLLLTGVSGADLPDPVPRPPIFATLTKPVGLSDLRDGVERARARFREWADSDPEVGGTIQRSREERGTIARAVRQIAGDDSLAETSAALLERARQEGRPLVDVARRLLADAR